MSPERLNSLRYRAWRRGFREADLILGPFADRELASLPAEQQAAFEQLLDTPDTDLYAWIVGREAAPANLDGPLLQRLSAFARTGLTA